jgi:hypothetical protein
VISTEVDTLHSPEVTLRRALSRRRFGCGFADEVARSLEKGILTGMVDLYYRLLEPNQEKNMRTNGGFMAQCQDCNVTTDCATQLQRERWVFKHHIGHTVLTWRREVSHA